MSSGECSLRSVSEYDDAFDSEEYEEWTAQNVDEMYFEKDRDYS